MSPEADWESGIHGIVQNEQELIESGNKLLQTKLRDKDVDKIRGWQGTLIETAGRTAKSQTEQIYDETRQARINELERISNELHTRELKLLEAWWVHHKDLSDYDIVDRKQNVLRPFLKEIDDRGLIGPRVLDVGAGPNPLSTVLKKPGRQLIAFDHTAPKEEGDFTYIQGDVRAMTLNPKLIEENLRRALGTESGKVQVDTIIFSDILNYTPYEEMIKVFGQFLKPGGLLIVLNKPDRTFVAGQGLLHPDAPTSVSKTVDTIEKAGYRTLFRLAISPKRLPHDDQYMDFQVYRREDWLQSIYGAWKYHKPLPIGPEDGTRQRRQN